MNFLGHLYLSGEDDDVRLGNFIGDAVKGSDYEKYPDGIKKGILLHRAIDSYTDEHEMVIQSKSHLRDKYGIHSGIIVDIFYDHFLASRWTDYSDKDLKSFISESYGLIRKNYFMLPGRVKKFAPFMIMNDWIGSYKTIKGIKSILFRMSRSTVLLAKASKAGNDLEEHYDDFLQEFRAFFPNIIRYVEGEHGVNINLKICQ